MLFILLFRFDCPHYGCTSASLATISQWKCCTVCTANILQSRPSLCWKRPENGALIGFLFSSLFKPFGDTGCSVSLHSVHASVGVWTCGPLLPETRNQFDWKTPGAPSLQLERLSSSNFVCGKCVFTMFNNRYCARWSGGRALSSSDLQHHPELTVLGRIYSFFFSSALRFVFFSLLLMCGHFFCPVLSCRLGPFVRLSVHPLLIWPHLSFVAAQPAISAAACRLINSSRRRSFRHFCSCLAHQALKYTTHGIFEGADLLVKCVGEKKTLFCPAWGTMRREPLHNK